jgi:hypothetical protein
VSRPVTVFRCENCFPGSVLTPIVDGIPTRRPESQEAKEANPRCRARNAQATAGTVPRLTEAPAETA